jgi:hypothetical protein
MLSIKLFIQLFLARSQLKYNYFNSFLRNRDTLSVFFRFPQCKIPLRKKNQKIILTKI